MRTNHFRVLALVVAFATLAVACGDDGLGPAADEPDGTTTTDATETTSTAPPTTAAIPEGGEALADLLIIAVTFGAFGTVTIENRGDEDADVNGIWICQFPTYKDLGTIVPGAVIAAGSTVEIPGVDLGGLEADAGEAALYTTNDFGSADAIFAFVQWGGGGARGAVAAEKNIWPGADVTVTPDPEFDGIELFGDPVDPESWS